MEYIENENNPLFTVTVEIPCYMEKKLYIYAVNKTEARKVAKAWGEDKVDVWDSSGDGYPEQKPEKLKVKKVDKHS
jgi:hypothetical protein